MPHHLIQEPINSCYKDGLQLDLQPVSQPSNILPDGITPLMTYRPIDILHYRTQRLAQASLIWTLIAISYCTLIKQYKLKRMQTLFKQILEVRACTKINSDMKLY